MPTRSGRAHYVLPETVDPVDRVCYVVRVPDDKQHIAAFLGQIYDLAWSKSWQNDPTHKAADVARVWQVIFDDLIQGPCEVVNIRLKPTDFCTIQLTTDGGVTWDDVADLSACANAAVVSGIQDALDHGILAPQGQGGEGVPPVPGTCIVYHVQIDGVGAWHCPIPVSDGDTIQIENSDGAWCGGPALLNLWYCPNGQQFVLGVCADPPIMDGADPLVTQPHMRLIAGYGPTPVYVDAYDTLITIPGGTGSVDFWLQPNDSVQADNFGSISAKVTVCRVGWTHTFDFMVSDGGWAALAGYFAVYTPGVGWQTTVDSGNARGVINRPGMASTQVTHAEVFVTFGNVANGGSRAMTLITGGFPAQNLPAGSGTFDYSFVISGSAVTDIWVIYDTFAHPEVNTITKIILQGLGADPF